MNLAVSRKLDYAIRNAYSVFLFKDIPALSKRQNLLRNAHSVSEKSVVWSMVLDNSTKSERASG